MESRDHDLPDLVRDTKLEAEVRGLITIHTWAWQRRKREIWKREPEPIGSGGYGLVWLERQVDHRLQPLGTNVRAVKQIRAIGNHDVVRDCFRELEAVAKFSQAKYADHFVKSSGWFEGPGSLYLAMEFCPLGDLRAYVVGSGILPEADARIVTRQIFIALAHMHAERFAHRDLKPANVLIVSHPPKPWMVKLSDFGLTRRWIAEDSTTAKGTFAFLPPELLGKDNRRCDPIAADIWSAGESSYYLLTSKSAFDRLTTRMRYVSDGTMCPSHALRELGVSVDAQQYVQDTMHRDPKARPSARDALDLPWLSIEEEDPYSLLLGPDAWDGIIDTTGAPENEAEASAQWSTGSAYGFSEQKQRTVDIAVRKGVGQVSVSDTNSHDRPETPVPLRFGSATSDSDLVIFNLPSSSSNISAVSQVLDPATVISQSSHAPESGAVDRPGTIEDGSYSSTNPSVPAQSALRQGSNGDHTQVAETAPARKPSIMRRRLLGDADAVPESRKVAERAKNRHVTFSTETTMELEPKTSLQGKLADFSPLKVRVNQPIRGPAAADRLWSIPEEDGAPPDFALTETEAGLKPNRLTNIQWSSILGYMLASESKVEIPDFEALVVMFHSSKGVNAALDYFQSFTHFYQHFRVEHDDFDLFTMQYTCMLVLLITLNHLGHPTIFSLSALMRDKHRLRTTPTWNTVLTSMPDCCTEPSCRESFGHRQSNSYPCAVQCLSCWGFFCTSHREEDEHMCALAGVWEIKVHYYLLVRAVFATFDRTNPLRDRFYSVLEAMRDWVANELDGMDADSLRIKYATAYDQPLFPTLTFCTTLARSIIIGHETPAPATGELSLDLHATGIRRRHAKISLVEGEWVIQTLDPRAWIAVNGKPLKPSRSESSSSKPVVLNSGDTVDLQPSGASDTSEWSQWTVAIKVYFFDMESSHETRVGHLPASAQEGSPTYMPAEVSPKKTRASRSRRVHWAPLPAYM